MTCRATAGAVLSLVAFGLIFGLIVWPLVCAICLIGLLVGKRFIRSWVARTAHWWGAVVFSCVRILLRLNITEPIIQGDVALIRGKTCIVISNHQGTMDIPLDVASLKQLGQINLRWVIKYALRDVPFIGWIARIIGCAFVHRNGDPADLTEVERCATIAREDGASVFSYPEGRRFDPSQTSAGFTHVLPPKTSGFERLCELLPDAPIVTITKHWSRLVTDGSQGKTIFSGADYYGKSLYRLIRIVPRSEVRCPKQWLNDDFKEKNRLLSQL